MRRRALLATLGLATLGLLPAGATATDGSLYPYGATVWAVQAPFTASVLEGPTWQIQTPARSPAVVADVWEMNWGCPVPGSEIAAVMFSALRTQAPSSLEVRVTSNRVPLWAEPDVLIPQSPAAGRAYDVRLAGGHCNVHLMLTQVEQRTQHARGYFIAAPRILVRDIAPPTVAVRTLPQGWLGAGAALHADWSVADNFGADGVGPQRIAVGGQVRWSGAPGAGNHGVDIDLGGMPDGVHAVDIVADGDGTTAGGASGTVKIDRTGPSATDVGSASPGTRGVITATWRASDNLSGVESSRAEINAAGDGGTGGAWVAFGPTGGAGVHSVTAAPPVGDGAHAWRIRTQDAAGNVSITPGPSPLVIDGHAPSVDLHAIPSGWINRLDLDLTATDALDALLGLGATEVDVNAATDGSESGEWVRRSTTTGPAGRRVIPVTFPGLTSGRHALRVTVRNGGPFGGALATEVRALVRIDLDAPAISRAGFAPAEGRPMTVAWTADDVHSGLAAATVQWRQGGTWRTLASERASDGSGSMLIDVSALPNGPQAFRLVVADAAGNVAARSATAQISGAGVGSIASDPLGRLRTARLTVTLAGARPERRDGRVVLVRRIAAGRTVTLQGVLLDRRRRPIVGAEVQARGYRGRLIGRGLTRSGGRFALLLKPVGGGAVRIGVASGKELLPRRPRGTLRLEVQPRLEVSASASAVPAGGTVLFSGRLSPSPGELGLGSRKSVVLEWLDPLRRTWRPVVNARLRRDGTYAIPWTFNVRGLTIPMRVSVPQDVGWPLLPARSGVVRVRVA